jgi:hypothetical protein
MVPEASPQSKIPTKPHNRPAPGPGGPLAPLEAARDRAAQRGPAACCAGMPAQPPAETAVWWWSWSAG